MQVNVQSRSVLYDRPGPILVPEGIYEAALVEIRRFTNAFGERIGLVFELVSEAHAGTRLMESAALNDSPRGKLAGLLRGVGGADASIQTAHELVGSRCRVAIRHEATRTGKRYAAIVQTFR